MHSIPQLTELLQAYRTTLTEKGGALYLPEFVQPQGLAPLKSELLELPWLTKRTARHEYFMASKPRTYSYAGSDDYQARAFTPLVLVVLHALNRFLGTAHNVCFLNKYDDQFQHLGWHADDSALMDHREPVSVVTFGAEREIWVKEKGYSGLVPDAQRILLEDGSLFVMPPGYQDTHLHRIPKHDRPCGWRISLTFRTFLD